MSEINELVPLTTDVWIAGELLDTGRVRLYRMIGEGSLRVLPGRGVARVIVSSIETALGGHRITPEEFAAAVVRAEPKRTKALAYQSQYRLKRAVFEKKQSAKKGRRSIEAPSDEFAV